jgi:sugar phosphate isomerase/epimerase
MKGFRVGIDNYGLHPLGLTPLETLAWAHAHGAQGVQFSGLAPEEQARLDRAALRDLAQYARDHDLYLEWGGAQHVPRDLTTWQPKEIDAVNRRAAAQAAALGTRVVRSCSGGLMRWSEESPPTEVLLAETARALRAQRSMLRDHGVVVAIETHFEFTSHELVRLLDMCESDPGECFGICLDTMNLLTMLEDPVQATKRLLRWVVATHVKDGGAFVDRRGLTTFTAPIGDGVIDLGGVIALLGTRGRDVHLSVEDHGGSFSLPIYDSLFLSRFPDLTVQALARIIEISQASAAKAVCRPLERERWPSCCEGRLAADIRALHSLVQGVEA